ncbi:hypothetical protein GQ44DRAFT_728781 [Phaeosphaeriaceae sp. PMI808]|nr:hypothetical protein GQ44DRAFT_728781 [Phaeosphaeriaceae sp. PMI808]
MVYDFKDLTPSPDFNWTPCFDNFICTLLTVPLDYKNIAAGTTNIAYIKWSTNSTCTDSTSGPQDILINPGGPGGSGVEFLLKTLTYFQAALGTQNNIVSFDPRAVNNSGPDLSCFPGQHHTQLLYDDRSYDATDVNDTNSLVETWARAGAFGEWCTKVHSASNSSAKYVNTVATATDMLHYSELLAKSKGEDPSKSQLWYYGVSYGTVLRSTFASLFLDRVGRMILDGVVDGEDYYNGKRASNLPDADAAIDTFFKYCYEGGPDQCSFWAESPEAIKTRYNAVIEKLKARPLVVTDEMLVMYPTIITYTDYKTTLLQMPYGPSEYYPIFADTLADLENGDAGLLAELSGRGIRKESCSKYANKYGDVEPPIFISCIDANGRYNLTDYDKWVDHVNQLVSQSHYLGEVWATAALSCRSLNIRAPESQTFNGPPSASNASNPILFMSATIDPVTPFVQQRK